ncbi:Aldo/keto reductase [Cutaneotrichosporon oleaginosum]|uniref:Aldo/keto reductase n=1 Tax=Cutaneotrichosporon oleaginosum TaxID=879819 RepID=A0A0J0XG91_9TREE|nr:Aldo/keto reductase [Cutaneotrichosporon oleaginosum]KLT40076.1 Aldo/keto reductase [Cutaneotrichosporon oleaginosum]
MPIETTTIGGPAGLSVLRLINGLWHLADGHGRPVDANAAAAAARGYVDAGLGAFDCADHYGPAEEIVGAARTPGLTAFTKWCPAPGVTGAAACAEAVERACARMRTDAIDLLQYHVWRYDDVKYIDNLHHLSLLQEAGKIKHLGLTNVDLRHLRMLHSSGFRIASNEVSVSVLDTRARRMGEWAEQHGVALLAYGTLLGGFISDKWLGKPEPREEELTNWGLKKYKRFIDVAGGWAPFQALLQALTKIAAKHTVPISAVAIRYALQQPGVAAVVIGARLDASNIDANKVVFTFVLDAEDLAAILAAQDALTPLPGDCGDEYRYPPFLTASGDLSHHLADDERAQREEVERVAAADGRIEVSSGSPYEPIAGYCRGVRTGDTFAIAGTTTRALPSGHGLVGVSAAEQATHAFDIIAGAVRALGASMADVTRTRVLLSSVEGWEDVVRVHGAVFGPTGARPVNTTVGGTTFIGEGILIEIEAEGRVTSGPRLLL